MIRIEVPMNPQTKPSTQFGIVGGHVRTWNRSTPIKNWLVGWLKTEIKNKKIEIITDPSVPLIVDISYFLPIPKSAPKWKKNLMKWGIEPHVSKPDRDNLTKFHLDAGNGLLWPDDRQIIDGRLFKRYSHWPRVLYEIRIANNDYSLVQIEVGKLFSPNEIAEIMSCVFGRNEIPVENLSHATCDILEAIIQGESILNEKLLREYGLRLKKLEKIFAKAREVCED